MDRGYNVITIRIGADGPAPAEGAAYVEFINQGDAPVMVENVTILPFGSWSPTTAVAGDLDFTQYRIKFNTPANNKSLVMVRKFYNDAV